jgi:DsbC/DsbD-like thiol-disulfide interchange protein
MPRFRPAQLLVAAWLVLAPGAVQAAAWTQGQFSAARLLPAGLVEGVGQQDGLYALIEIKLPSGWKTYWRNPGDSGVAARFDWTGSVNLDEATVLWPRPHGFGAPGERSVGYDGEVVRFPVRVEPGVEGRPVVLSLKLDYAVCETLCVPEEAELSAILRPSAPEAQAGRWVREALGLVPERVQAAQAGAPGIAAVEPSAPDRLLVRTTAFPGADKAELFAEASEGDPLLQPVRVGMEAGAALFELPLARSRRPSEILFTLVGPNRAIEQAWLVE